MNARLALGPLLFNWDAAEWRDFYMRIADEADVDTVYIGEVICTKRMPFFAPYFQQVAQRLRKAGKEVVYSSLALIANERDAAQMRDGFASAGLMIELNDLGLLGIVEGKPHVVGPLINIYNEGTLAYLAKKGAVRACLPPELPLSSVSRLTSTEKVEIEILAFGRMPLAISARCFHARAYRLHKDGCNFVCRKDPDGLAVETLDREPFLAVNGMQVLSYTCCNLLGDLPSLSKAGVNRFRLSPARTDMVAVARIFRNVLEERTETVEATAELSSLLPGVPFSNGFLRGREGRGFVE